AVHVGRNLWGGGATLVASGASAETSAAIAALVDGQGHRPSGTLERSTLTPAPGGEPEWFARAKEWHCPELPGGERARARTGPSGGLETIVMGEWGPWDFRSGEPRPPERKSGGAFASAHWDATWFRWSKDLDPREKLAPWRALAATPLVEKRVGN